ncbi:unnamed protein product, partial [Prorocentrum cordatum]
LHQAAVGDRRNAPRRQWGDQGALRGEALRSLASEGQARGPLRRDSDVRRREGTGGAGG